MSGSETAVIIIDSASFDFSYQGDWSPVDSGTAWPYQLTTRNSRDRLGGFTFTFEGFDATIAGIPPLLFHNPLLQSTITIDPDSPNALTVPVNGPNETAVNYLPWYRTPDLAYGTHRIVMTNCYQVGVDYALVTIGPETDLTGKTMFVDDNDPQIQYLGSGWKMNNESTLIPINGGDTYLPAQNTTHETTRIGDSFQLSFLGTSVTVYGLFSWTNLSSIVLQYDLDGNVTSVPYYVQQSDSQYIFQESVYINSVFNSYHDISPSIHQLKVTVKEISNTSFRFDYITYTPAFSNLASMSGTPAAPGNSTTVFTPLPPLDSGDDQHLELKVVIGSVLGGLALLAIAVGCLVWWHRRLNVRKSIGGKTDASDVQGTTPFPSEKLDVTVDTHLNVVHVAHNATTVPTPYPPGKVLTTSTYPPQTQFPDLSPLSQANIAPYPQAKLPPIWPVLSSAQPITAVQDNRTKTDPENRQSPSVSVGTDRVNASSRPLPPLPVQREEHPPSEISPSHGLPPSYASVLSDT